MRQTSRMRQHELRFEESGLWQQTPEDERRRCVELLASLLGAVTRIEMEEEGKEDEREDHA